MSADELRDFLERTGYVLDALVDEPGEAAMHGRVVDLFPGGALGPVRIELEDGHIATISAYDPISQRESAAVPLRRAHWKPPPDFIAAVRGRVAQNQGEMLAEVGDNCGCTAQL